MANTKRIIDYPIATNLGTSNYVVGTVDDQTMRIPTDVISSSDFVVTFITTDGVNWTVDKTFSETMAAHNSGKKVIFSVPIMGVYFEPYCFLENTVIVASGAYSATFNISFVSMGTKINALYYAADNSVHVTESPDLTPEPRVYNIDGRNLKDVFGTAAAFHAAVAADDFSKIRVGDYWPITLTGSYRDYGEGATVGQYATKSFSGATVILEVAAINPYWKYGDSGDIANGTPHVLFISRDCLPATYRYRRGSNVWEDESSKNPWVGSALYKTLNDPTNGIVHLVSATDIGAYIYGGADGNGMRYYGERRDPVTSSESSGGWYGRGKLLLPTEDEIHGRALYTRAYDLSMKELPIFNGTRRHIMKGIGNGGSRYYWLTTSMVNYSTGYVCAVTTDGVYGTAGDNSELCVPLCFLVT